MMWNYWITLYVDTHCAARGLAAKTMSAYRDTLVRFRDWQAKHSPDANPTEVSAQDVLTYLEHLRRDRGNGPSAINRHATVLKNFYRAIVALGHLEPNDNPLAYFPKIKGPPRKLPTPPSEQEVAALLDAPPTDTVLGLRDRALLSLLYGTGIRASECAAVRERDVDFEERTVRVTGKGGGERVVPLNKQVVAALSRYRLARGARGMDDAFFLSRLGRAMSRGAIYERVRTWSRRAKIQKRVSPHSLRHAFATHLVRKGVNLVTIRDLLGHRQITSTQIYLHVTAEGLREAADLHPISRLAPLLDELLPDVKLPFQRVPHLRRGAG
ncbi:MAG: tyrosine-type recombinase/integrase [Planctomycetales bacterium]